MTTMYIHGFASTGKTSKVSQLEAILGEPVLAPTLTHRPADDLRTLSALVEEHNVTTVVGSSLGGFYALYLGQKFDLRLVLINPALEPYETLQAMKGDVKVYGTDTVFSWGDDQIAELREAATVVNAAVDSQASGLTWANVLILLAAKDELLDTEKALRVFEHKKVILDLNEDHRFGNILPYAEYIRKIEASTSDYGEPNPTVL